MSASLFWRVGRVKFEIDRRMHTASSSRKTRQDIVHVLLYRVASACAERRVLLRTTDRDLCVLQLRDRPLAINYLHISAHSTLLLEVDRWALVVVCWHRWLVCPPHVWLFGLISRWRVRCSSHSIIRHDARFGKKKKNQCWQENPWFDLQHMITEPHLFFIKIVWLHIGAHTTKK